MWEVSDPAACPGQSSHCETLQRLSCSFQGCSSASLPAAQYRVVHTGLADRFITGATVTASCSNGGDQYSVLETFRDPDLVMSASSLQYSPQYAAPSPWCLHPDCHPLRGVPWLAAATSFRGSDCVEEESGTAWCLGDPTVLQWQDGEFVLSDQSYSKYLRSQAKN